MLKLKSDHLLLSERYRSLDNAFFKEEDSLALDQMRKDYLDTAKRAKVIDLLLNNLD